MPPESEHPPSDASHREYRQEDDDDRERCIDDRGSHFERSVQNHAQPRRWLRLRLVLVQTAANVLDVDNRVIDDDAEGNLRLTCRD